MLPENFAYLWDALNAARKAQLIVADTSRETYLADWMRQAAAERQLEIIGEALGRICSNRISSL